MKKTTKKQEYDNSSIGALVGAERIRKRPGVMLGSSDIIGCQHTAFEVLSNSIDEAREGHGTEIIVTRYLDNSIEVEDFGRGCPVDSTQRPRLPPASRDICAAYIPRRPPYLAI